MASWSLSNPSWTPVAVAHTATMTANGACFIQGGSATQKINLLELKMGGLAASSAPCNMLLGRDSTVAVTSITLGTNGMNAALSPFTAALNAPQVVGFSATTMPQRSSTLGGLLQATFNAFGGDFRWVAGYKEEISLYGAAASLGELSLSCWTGGTPGGIASTIIYETE